MTTPKEFEHSDPPRPPVVIHADPDLLTTDTWGAEPPYVAPSAEPWKWVRSRRRQRWWLLVKDVRGVVIYNQAFTFRRSAVRHGQAIVCPLNRYEVHRGR